MCMHIEKLMHMPTALYYHGGLKMAANLFNLSSEKKIYCRVQTKPLLQNLYKSDFYCANTQRR